MPGSILSILAIRRRRKPAIIQSARPASDSIISPTFTRRLSERTSLGGDLLYQVVRYSSEVELDRVDYDYGQALGFIGWAIGPNRDIELGGYVSKYEARNFLNEADAYGATLAFNQEWSEKADTRFEVVYESNDIVTDSIPLGETTSNFGGNLTSILGRGGQQVAPHGREELYADRTRRQEHHGPVAHPV